MNMTYKATLWKELTKIIGSSKCTLGEKKQLLDCWADNLNIPQTCSWNEQRIMEDADRIIVALKKDTEITGSTGLEKQLTYLVEWNVCTKTEMRKLLQKYNMMKEESKMDVCVSMRQLIEELQDTECTDEATVDICRRKFKLYCDKKMKYSYVTEVEGLGLDIIRNEYEWESKIKRFIGIIETAIEDIEFDNPESGEDIQIVKSVTVKNNKNLPQKDNNKIFIVHGHDEGLKYNVCSWLYELGLEPIILHEQANGGIKGVLQKIKDNSDVACAIILMTADDEGKALKEEQYNKRARQNVVFEAGYFIGKLGEDRVIILQDEGIERPSDIEECIYIVADKHGGWRDKVRKEFKTMGITYKG